MSQIQLNPFFDFCRFKVMKQSFDHEKQMVTMIIHPDERYDAVCHHCQHKVTEIHSYHQRRVRGLNCFDSQIILTVKYRTVRCPRCGNRVEELDLVHPEKRMTKRLAQYILFLCSVMTIKEVARCLNLNWKTVKAIHKGYLKTKFSHKMDEKILVFWQWMKWQ